MDLATGIWAAGSRLRSVGQRLGIAGPLDSVTWRIARRVLPPPTHETVATLPHNLSLTLPPGLANARTYLSGSFERPVVREFERIVTAGMTVVDVGANIGYYTLLASRLVGASGSVFAFEPDDRMYASLLTNVANNACDNVITKKAAITDRSGNVNFATDPGGTGGSVSAGAERAVDSAALDDLNADVDVVKMDIEGGEVRALAGMRALAARRPHLALVIEYHLEALSRSGANQEAFIDALRGVGFSRALIMERGIVCALERLPGRGGVYNLLLSSDIERA